MSFFTREQCLQRLHAQIASGKPIIGGGAGTGISAKCAETGGIDLIIIYNSGRFRMAGRGSLSGMMPYGDANQIVMDMAREVLPIVKNTPVLAGVCGTDPFRIMKLFLREVQAAGFSGVQNFPTVGPNAGTTGETRPGAARCGEGDQSGHSRSLPRRANFRSGGRRLHPEKYERHCRVLRRLKYRTTPYGGCNYQLRAAV